MPEINFKTKFFKDFLQFNAFSSNNFAVKIMIPDFVRIGKKFEASELTKSKTDHKAVEGVWKKEEIGVCCFFNCGCACATQY